MKFNFNDQNQIDLKNYKPSNDFNKFVLAMYKKRRLQQELAKTNNEKNENSACVKYANKNEDYYAGQEYLKGEERKLKRQILLIDYQWLYTGQQQKLLYKQELRRLHKTTTTPPLNSNIINETMLQEMATILGVK